MQVAIEDRRRMWFTIDMRSSGRRRSCRAALFAAAVAAFAGPAIAAEPQAPADLPLLKPLSAPKQSMRKARIELLNTLYDQLKAAESDESAALIVSAIEKVWSASGSDTADLLMQRAGLAVKNRNYDLAMQILAGLTAIEPRYTEGWNQLATIYFLQEDYKQAMRQLRQVLALEPRHFKAIEGLGIILRELGRNEAALKATRRALEVNPHLKSAKQAEEELTREVEGQGL